MDKPLFKQILDYLDPYIAPFLAGFFAIFRFLRSYTKAIDEKFTAIQLDVAVLKTNHTNQAEKIEDLTATIKQIAQDVSTIKGQKEGVSIAILDQMQHLENMIGTKFTDYDNKIAILFSIQKPLPK